MRENLKAKTIGLIWVNNDFGKTGRDLLKKSLDQAGPTEPPLLSSLRPGDGLPINATLMTQR